jgi:DhnA family fructose-bisphosphate aldolase class Ia
MLQKPYVDYIMMMAKETGQDFINRKYVEKFTFDKYQKVADELDELYKLQQTSKNLDHIIAEIQEYGADYVKEKYGINSNQS